MTEEDYHRYIEAFNARDYAGLETYFTDDFALENAGFRIEGKQTFRDFYAFVHAYFRETVTFKGFYPGEDGFVANVVIRFEGEEDLTAAILAGKGYPGMTPIPKGSVVDIEFLILYLLNDQGMIKG